MSFTNPGPIGGYATGDVIAEDEINYWCAALPDCIDGAGGGTYTLSNPLVLNGDNVVIGENLTVTGDLSVLGDTTIGSASSDQLTVNATTLFTNEVSMYGDITLGNNISDSLGVNCTAIFGNPVTFVNDVTLGFTTTHIVYLKGLLTPTSGGRVLETGIVCNDADQSIDITLYRHVYISSSNTAERTYTLTGTVTDGDWFVVQNHDSIDHNITGLSSGIIIAGRGAKYLRISGTWRVVMAWEVD